MTLEAGTALGPYRVSRKLGAGGMGEVYAALDPRLNREVAIKVLTADLLRDPESLRRFHQEANAVAALNHPNIVQIFDMGNTDQGEPFLVMELLEGESLRVRMDGKPMPLRKVAELSAQIARALGAAHAKGIIHRDLKPENVFLTKSGPTKILDFGLAKLSRKEALVEPDATRALFTRPGMVMGTVGYMAPELVEGETADGRADIFALGIMMWEMLSGHRPFLKQSSIDTLHAILREDPPEIPQELGLPSAMERILRRCLEKHPDDRFQSANDLAFQLENVTVASSSLPTAQIRNLREEGSELPWYRRPYRLFYPLPIGLPARLRVCFWDRVQLSIAYLLLALSLGALTLALLGKISYGPFSRRETAKVFEPAVSVSGNIQSATISRDGRQTLVAMADEGGHVNLIYQQSGQNPVNLEKAPAEEVLALSNTGSALLRNPAGDLYLHEMGETAAAMKIATHVQEADLSPDGTKVALLRHAGDQFTIEYPQGARLYASSLRLRSLKVSPAGDAVAFFEREATSGLFQLKVWKNGKVDTWIGDPHLSPNGRFPALDIQGMAWNAQGDGLYLVLQGNLLVLVRRQQATVLHRNAGPMRVCGATLEGPLLEAGTEFNTCRGRIPGNPKEQDLDWVSGQIFGLSDDGSRLLVARDNELWLVPSDRSPGRKVGTGTAEDLSSDGKTLLFTSNDRLLAMPTEGGDTVLVASRADLQGLGFIFSGDTSFDPKFTLSDDARFVLISQRQHLVRKALQGNGTLDVLNVPAEGLAQDWRIDGVVSPDGQRVALQIRDDGEQRSCLMVNLQTQKQEQRTPMEDTERLMAWGGGSSVLTFRTLKGSGEFHNLDLKSGTSRVLAVTTPPYPNTSARFRNLRCGVDGSYYTYRYTTTGLSRLVVAKGM